MVSPFGPVEALPSNSTARRLQAGHIETDVAKPLDAEGAYIKSLVWKRNDEPSFTQSLRYGDAYLPGQVIVAAPGEPQFLCGRAECFSADQPGVAESWQDFRLPERRERRQVDSSDAVLPSPRLRDHLRAALRWKLAVCAGSHPTRRPTRPPGAPVHQLKRPASRPGRGPP
jgi:hypothetical protein